MLHAVCGGGGSRGENSPPAGAARAPRAGRGGAGGSPGPARGPGRAGRGRRGGGCARLGFEVPLELLQVIELEAVLVADVGPALRHGHRQRRGAVPGGRGAGPHAARVDDSRVAPPLSTLVVCGRAELFVDSSLEAVRLRFLMRILLMLPRSPYAAPRPPPTAARKHGRARGPARGPGPRGLRRAARRLWHRVRRRSRRRGAHHGRGSDVGRHRHEEGARAQAAAPARRRWRVAGARDAHAQGAEPRRAAARRRGRADAAAEPPPPARAAARR